MNDGLTKEDKALTICSELYNISEEELVEGFKETFYSHIYRHLMKLARKPMPELDDLFGLAERARESKARG